MIDCVWEHNGPDSLLYAVGFPGAYSRGVSLEEAIQKMPAEIQRYCRWLGITPPARTDCCIVQEAATELLVRDADSDVLFIHEHKTLTRTEYERLKTIAMRSAEDFHAMYLSIPDPSLTSLAPRSCFYGPVPRTACEMYAHTRNVNDYYFGEIGVQADHSGTIVTCRQRGFDRLEQLPDFLDNAVFEGSYGEYWTLRKVIRRFIWHDRIHGKALFRMAKKTFPNTRVANPFDFD